MLTKIVGIGERDETISACGNQNRTRCAMVVNERKNKEERKRGVREVQAYKKAASLIKRSTNSFMAVTIGK